MVTRKHLKKFALVEDATPSKWEGAILKALAAINAKSGNRYTPEQVLKHLEQWKAAVGDQTAIWLAVDEDLLNIDKLPQNCVVGFLTLDLGRDDAGCPVAMMSRGWTAPGYGADIWAVVCTEVEAWARAHKCRRIQFQSERGALAGWLGGDAFKEKETIYEKEITL